MGNSTGTTRTPGRKASNTTHAYTGSIENLYLKKLAFQLYNPVYGQTLFVSATDKMERDHLVESHSSSGKERNQFYLQKVDGTDWPGYVLYNCQRGGYLFVSNDRGGHNDHFVESHPFIKEKRNCFEFRRRR